MFGRRFETWCIDVARLLIECVKKIADEHGEYEIDVPMRGAYLPLKWSDVEIDGYQLQMQSVGQLYMSFAGRLDKLKTLFEMGAIDRGTFMRQLDAGDVQGELDLETADRLCVDEMIESMLDIDPDSLNGRRGRDYGYIAPHPYLPLEWAMRRAHQRRLQAEIDGAPEAILRLLSRYIDDCQYLIDKKKASAMGPAGGPVDPLAPAPVPGGPAPPPPMPGPPMPIPPPPGGPMPPIAA